VQNDSINYHDIYGRQTTGMQNANYTEEDKVLLQVTLQGGQCYCKNRSEGKIILDAAYSTTLSLIATLIGFLKCSSSAVDVYQKAVAKLEKMMKDQAKKNARDVFYKITIKIEKQK
jgi:hypothetical protein